MRIYHRYLGFFLAGIMAVYAISGIVLIFRDTDVFKREVTLNKTLPEGTQPENVGKELRIREFNIEKIEGNLVYFKEGTYNTITREAIYTKMEMPTILDKMAHLHKATSSKPLAFLNIFFGVALFFFVISTFWMFAPGTDIFKKGIRFSVGGLLLAIVLLFV